MSMKKFVYFIFLLLLPVLAWSQCMITPVTLQDRINNATVVVDATAIQQNSYWNNSNDFIYTSTTLSISAVYKGAVQGSQIALITEGGIVGNIMIKSEPSLNIKPGQNGIFFLIPHNQPSGSKLSGMFEGYALSQSFILFDETSNTATGPFENYSDINALRNQIINATGGVQRISSIAPQPMHPSVNKIMIPPTIASIVPATTTAGTFSIITINGNNFGATYVNGTSNVEFPDANTGGGSYISAPQNHIQSWNNTQIQVWVPSQGGSGLIRVTNNLGETTTSGISLTVNYN